MFLSGVIMLNHPYWNMNWRPRLKGRLDASYQEISQTDFQKEVYWWEAIYIYLHINYVYIVSRYILWYIESKSLTSEPKAANNICSYSAPLRNQYHFPGRRLEEWHWCRWANWSPQAPLTLPSHHISLNICQIHCKVHYI